MADVNEKNYGAAKLEDQKNLALQSLLSECVRFFKNDVDCVEALRDLIQVSVAQAKKNPDVLFSDKGSDIQALIAALKAKSEAAHGHGDIAGHDIIGGGWLDDLATFIKTCGDFITSEKKVILAVLILIFCKDPCPCLCDFINSKG